jgi:hypothetical protein
VIEREQRHDEAGGAKATLGGVALHQGALHRVKVGAVGEVLDRDHLGPIGLTGEQDAGVDRLIDEAAADQPAQHHGAGAAVALGAAFLGAGRAFGEPQIVQ